MEPGHRALSDLGSELEMESFVFPVPHLEESLISLRPGLRFRGHLSYGQYSWLITIKNGASHPMVHRDL